MTVKLNNSKDQFYANEEGTYLSLNASFAGNTEGRVVDDLGKGVFRYEGIQSAEDVKVTLWKMSIYGAEVGGDPLWVGQRASLIYGVSVSKDTRAAELPSTIFGDGELAA